MNMPALKELVAQAYAVADSSLEIQIPRYAAQFRFADNENQVLVRIPIHACQPPEAELALLICKVIHAARPQVKKSPADLTQDLLAAASGADVRGELVDIRGEVETTVASAGARACAVTGCLVLIR